MSKAATLTHFYRETEASRAHKAKKLDRAIVFLDSKVKTKLESIKILKDAYNPQVLEASIKSAKDDIKVLQKLLDDETKINELFENASQKLAKKTEKLRKKTRRTYVESTKLRNQQIQKQFRNKTPKGSTVVAGKALGMMRRKTWLIKKGNTFSDFM